MSMIRTLPGQDDPDAPLLNGSRQYSKTDISDNDIRRIVEKYVRTTIDEDIVFDVPPDEALYAAIRTEITSAGYWCWALLERWVPVSCHAAHLMYPFRSASSRVILAMINTVALYADDALASDPWALKDFHLSLVLHRPQSDPVLEWFNTKQLPKLWQEFEPTVAGLIADSFHAFINGTLLEKTTAKMKYNPDAPFFSDYVRLKSGIPEVYAYFVFSQDPALAQLDKYIQATPDVVTWINFGNDILSFYKEQLDGDYNNFVHMRGKSSGHSLATVLERMIDESVAISKRVEKVLSGSPELLGFWRMFMKGYTDFHTISGRYKLKKLFAV